MTLLALLVVLVVLLSSLPVLTYAETFPTTRASVLDTEPLGGFELEGTEKSLGRLIIIDVPVDGVAFTQALRIETVGAASSAWNVQARTKSVRPIKSGDVLSARFWMRCVESMTGEGFTTFVMELARPGFDKSLEISASAGGRWQEYVVPFRAQRDFAPGEAQICLRAGFDRQIIDVGGIELVNYGRSVKVEDLPRTHITYAGREADAPWRAMAIERIEKLRKGDLRIKVQDSAGQSVADATVHVQMRRHAFGFGSAVAAEELLGDGPDNRHYRETFEKLFNRAVFENDMKWPQTYTGVPPRVDQAMKWLTERNIAARGHCLVWPSWRWLPRDLRRFESAPIDLRGKAAAHVTNLVTHFCRQLYQWDVINEPFSNHDLMDILGKDVMIDWFKLAHQADPQCKLYLNDYGILEGGGANRAHENHFYETIRYLQDNGAPIHGIGIQSHFGLALTPPAQMLKILDRFTELGLPIESTEVSLNINDRTLQADFMRDYMTSVFSHPNVHGIMLWGFWEGRHWRPDAALYDSNWTLRPHGKVWIDLVHRQWKTDAHTKTDGSGAATVRGFCGDYDVTVTVGDRSKTVQAGLPRDGQQLTITLE